jgi:hypothetical protein
MAAETHKILKEAFGDNALGLTKTYEWFKRFKNGWMSVDDDERSGRPSTGMTENVAKCKRLSWKTEGEQFTTFVTLLNCSMEHVSKFCRMSSTCGHTSLLVQ